MNDQQARQLLDRLRRLADATRNGRPVTLPEGAVSRLDEVEKNLLEAMRRDRTGSPAADGYPTGTLSNGGDDAAQSSTEAAALASWGKDGQLRTPVHDRHHELTVLACQHLDAAVDHITRLLGALEAVDRLATLHRPDPSGACQACARHVPGTAVDRIIGGWCHECRTAWLNYVQTCILAGITPDRYTFARQRRQAG